MLDDLLQRKPYNAVADFVDAPVARGLRREDCVHRCGAFAQLRRTAGAHLPVRGGAEGTRAAAGRAPRAAALRHGRLSGCLLGRRARRHCGAAAQYAAHRRSVRLHPRRQPRLGNCRRGAARQDALVPILDRLPRLRTIILVNAGAERARRVCRPRRPRFRRTRGARTADAVHGADTIRRSRFLDVHIGLDRRTQRRQARPHHADGGGAADGSARHRHPRGRRGVFRGQAVLLLRHGQRHGVPDVGRRDHGVAVAAPDPRRGV